MARAPSAELIFLTVPALSIAKSSPDSSNSNPSTVRLIVPPTTNQCSLQVKEASSTPSPAPNVTARHSLNGQRDPRFGMEPVLPSPGTINPGTVGIGGPTSSTKICIGRFLSLESCHDGVVLVVGKHLKPMHNAHRRVDQRIRGNLEALVV